MSEEPDKFKRFRENLKTLRFSKKMDKTELDNALKYKKGRVSDLECRFDPTLDDILTISDYFGIKMDDLIYSKVVLSVEVVFK